VTLDSVAGSLPPSSALVAFTQYKAINLTKNVPGDAGASSRSGAPAGGAEPRQYLAFVLRTGERDPQVVSLGQAPGIDAAVSRWKQEASRDGLESAYREAGGSLRKLVWDPLGQTLGDTGRVFVVPDGSLSLVSVGALPLDEGGYVIERGPQLHYLSAERDLVPSGQARPGEGLLTVGAPNYDATSMFAALRKPDAQGPPPATGTSTYRGQASACRDFASARFAPLPATGKETQEIVRMWGKQLPGDSPVQGGVVDLRDAAATESALKRSAPGRRVLHLATHGFFLGGSGCESALASSRGIGALSESPSLTAEPGRPTTGENPLLLSGLVLAGANHRSSAGKGEDDGILTAEEIASLDLSGVQWAVLSACETGVGDIRTGEGVFGLRRAFQVAGVGTLIMSLWSVDDEATRAWMKSLYQGRLAKKLDTVEAVRRASLAVLAERRARKQSTHPFYWAAFVAAGDWR
jgi:CHAT domain-containing protein